MKAAVENPLVSYQLDLCDMWRAVYEVLVAQGVTLVCATYDSVTILNPDDMETVQNTLDQASGAVGSLGRSIKEAIL